MREMQSPGGAYYSTLDADSEHEEGKFYVWTPDEVQALLTPDEYAVLAPHYGLDRPANFEGEHWHLRVTRPLADVAASIGRPIAECERLLASARGKLFAVRERRIRPGRDEKILTSWNGLMIEGMARAARVFGRDDWLASARRGARLHSRPDVVRRPAARDLQGRSRASERLSRRLRIPARGAAGAAASPTGAPRISRSPRSSRDALLEKFEDTQTGGFAFTSHDHEALILRPKPGHDNATPSGNGVAALALQRLGHLVGEPRYLDAGERTLRLFQRRWSVSRVHSRRSSRRWTNTRRRRASWCCGAAVADLDLGSGVSQPSTVPTRWSSRSPRSRPACPRCWRSPFRAQASTPGYARALAAGHRSPR